MKKLDKKTRNDIKGITLVSLVLTIIILLILATVSISLVINNGILDKAKSAVDKYSDGEIEEQIKLAYTEWQTAKLTGTTENANEFIKSRLDQIYNNIEEVIVDNEKIDVTVKKNEQTYSYKYDINLGTISKSYKDYVGYYADIDADGTVDGVIFADLLTGSIRDTQQWRYQLSGYTTYAIPSTENPDGFKSYYVSKESYKWAKRTELKPVLSPLGEGKDRFYIMSLEDFTTAAYIDSENSNRNYPSYTSYYFYKNAIKKMNPLITLNEFGKGNENTGKMIARWNAAKTTEGYDAEQDNQDIWKHIQTKYEEGWFIPSAAEWVAFKNELGITNSDYNSTYELSGYYWSSSQSSNQGAFSASFYRDWMFWDLISQTHSIRLATTF